MDFINRHAEKTLKRFASSFPSVLVTGARQTGKTTLLKKITEKKSVPSTTFDDISEEEFAKTDPTAFLEFHQSPYMFDEIQYVPELFRYLKVQIDKDRHNGMYFLTGSQQFKLMEKATESLSGRIGIVQLYSLSAREIRGDDFSDSFLPAKDYILARNKAFSNYEFSVQKIWNRIFTGSYPEVVKKTDTAKNFFITNRLKNVQIAQPVIICGANKVSSVKKGEITAFVIPVEFI